MKNCVSILIPVFNEEENITEMLDKLNKYVGSCQCDNVYEIKIIDDGSQDDTYRKIKNYEFTNGSLQLIRFSKNYGSHSALRAGILHSTGDFVTFYYADMQDPIELIDKMINKAKEGNDIVWANREETGLSSLSKYFSLLYAKLMKIFVAKNFPDKGFDLVLFNKKVQKELNINIENNSSIFLQILNLGYKQTGISYKRNERLKGKSKWTFSKKIKLLIDSFVAFSYSPIRAVTIIGLAFSIFAFFWTLYIIFRAIIIGDLSPGWPALISVLLFGFGLTNISLGIIAEYLWRTFDAARKRPSFIIDEIIELNKKQ